MKHHYTLYLDESETHRFDNQAHKAKDFYFCMAGIIIKQDDIPQIEQDLIKLKETIWPDHPHPQQIILHQMRILEASKGRLKQDVYPEYAKFRSAKPRKEFYQELKKLFAKNSLTIVGSSISEDDLKQLYWVNGNKQDQYLIAMQLLLENYCHFLCTHNGIGNIIYEYRELLGNEKLRDKYYHMKLMGSMYITKAVAESRLLGLDFVDKKENVAGLQLADFIPNSFARDHAGIKQDKPNIFSTLKYHLYDGDKHAPQRFGVKYMP